MAKKYMKADNGSSQYYITMYDNKQDAEYGGGVVLNNFRGEYNESTSYNVGDTVMVKGHEPCYVFETTITPFSDPELMKLNKKVYRIGDVMYYTKEADGWEMIFFHEEDIDFSTICQLGTTQQYQSTVDNYYPYSKIGRCILNESGNEVYSLNKNDSTYKEDGSTAAKLDGTDGNVMVRMPKFYFQAKHTPRGVRLRVYSYENPTGKIALGIEPHPVFKNEIDGGWFDTVYTGAFMGTTTSDNKLVSTAPKDITVSQTQATFRARARQNRNIYWNIDTYYLILAEQSLWFVEFSELNSQKVMGNGRANTSSKSQTGTTIKLGNRSGRISDDASNGNISYRGIEDFWANVWVFVDGLILKDDGYHFTNNFNHFGSEANMIHIPKATMNTTDGYVTKLEKIDDYPFVFLPAAVGGSDSTYFCDYLWTHDTGETNLALFGGSWVYGSRCGVLCWSWNSVLSHVYDDFGARLSFFKKS